MARRSRKVEIWIEYADGTCRYMEEAPNMREAQAVINLMNRRNQYEAKTCGYGFPNGIPSYSIRTNGTAEKIGINTRITKAQLDSISAAL